MASDAITRSNKASALLTGLQAKGVEDLSYSMAMSFPNMANNELLEVQALQPISGSFYSQTTRFDIPKYSLLKSLYMKLNFSFTGVALTGSDATAFWQKQMFDLLESVSIRTRSTELVYMTGHAMREKAQSLSTISKSLSYISKALILNQTNSATRSGDILVGTTYDNTTYIPIFGWFSEDVLSMLDTGFCEQMQVVVKFNSSVGCGLDGATISSVSPSLFCNYNTPDVEAYNSLQAKNFGRATSLVQLAWNTITERQICTSLTQNTIRVRITRPSFCTSVAIVKNQEDRLAHRALCTTYSFIVNTRYYHQNVPLLMGNQAIEEAGYQSLIVQANGHAVNHNAVPALTLPWGLVPNDWSFNSGCISFNDVDSPQFEVNTLSLGTAAEHDIVCVNYYWTELVIGQNSQVVISTST